MNMKEYPKGHSPEDDLWIQRIVDENLRLQHLTHVLISHLNRDENKIPIRDVDNQMELFDNEYKRKREIL